MSTTKPPSQNAIGRELGLSSSNMTKLRKQGCPMDSVASVRAWRLEHQNIAQRKPEPRRTATVHRDHLAHAQACMRGAEALLAAGLPIDAFAPTLRAALAAVPPELRDAITFREVEGMSYEEIAERMDCPIGTVRSRIFRAREAIDARMQPLLDQDATPKRSHA